MSLAKQILSITKMFEAKEIFWHGTTTNAAKKIMKMGFLPTGKREQRWGADTGGLASYPGNYFTQNLVTATGAAAESCRTFGGSSVIIEVQIETRESYPDEDVIPEMRTVLPYSFQEVTLYLLTTWSAMQLLQSVDEGDASAKEMYEKILERAADDWIKQSMWSTQDKRGNVENVFQKLRPILKEWARVTLEIFTREDEGFEHHAGKEPEEYRNLEDKVLSYLRGFPSRVVKTDFTRNVRVKEPIGFRGANRILSIVALPFMTGMYDSELSKVLPSGEMYSWLVVYGTPSERLKKEYSERESSNFNVRRGTLEDVDNLWDHYKSILDKV